MSFRTLVQYRGAVPGSTIPEIRRARKDGLKRMLARWKSEMLPKHFELRAKIEYGYKPRSDNYSKRKAKKYGHQKPHVFSGRAREMATLGAGRLSGTSKSARLWFRIPYYYYISRERGIDLVNEVTAISDGDEDAMEATLDREIMNALNRSAAKRSSVWI